MELKLEIIVLPVSDVDRAKDFYVAAGFRLDADVTTDRGLRVVQVTPPGSSASIIFGDQLSSAAPGSVQGLHLITPDIARDRDDLAARGVDVSGLWHDADGVFHWADGANRVDGPSDTGDSYVTFASFADPDGNGWILQQIVDRLPGR